MNIGTGEILLILIIILILYGKRLPEVTRSLGKTLGQIKKSMDETKNELARIDTKEMTQTSPSETKAEPTPIRPTENKSQSENKPSAGKDLAG